MASSALLQLGNVQLWKPPTIFSELTGSRSTYTSNACGSVLESTDLTYKIYITHFCTLREAQQIQQSIEETLALAPNLTLLRQDTPDAILFRNKVKQGTVELSSEQTELRARFGSNRTIVLILTVTILPAGQGTGDAMFRHLRAVAATGGFKWPTDAVSALLFGDASTAPNELYAKSLAEFTDLDEIVTSGYARQTVTGKAVVEGSMVQLLMDDPEFIIAAGGAEVAGMVLFLDTGSDATSIPEFLISPPPFTPDGSLQIIHTDLTGLW